MQPRPLLRALALLGAAAGAAGAGVTPVQKVIQLLTGMAEKGGQDKHEEQVAFAKFHEFCVLTQEQREKSIEAATRMIASLQATIAKAEADATKLGDDIAGLEDDLAKWASEKARAVDVRAKQLAEYTAAHGDYSKSIDAVDRAIATLKDRSSQNATTSPSTAHADSLGALLDLRRMVSSPGQLPHKAHQVIATLMQATEGLDGSASGAPAGSAYEFQSTSVIRMLEKLRLRFIDERKTLEQEELNTKNAYELVLQSLSDDTAFATKQREEKLEVKGARLAEAAAAKGDLAETQEAKAADETYLRDLVANCETKSMEFEKRQALRAAEIEAIGKAIEIISSPAVAGVADAHLPAALLQQQKKKALLQLRGAGATADAGQLAQAQELASAYLRQQAEKVQSAFLDMVAARAAGDPFVKVRQMIKDMLARLIEEANQEAGHKGWCDHELGTNKQSRESLSAEVESLISQVDENTALLAKLGTEIGDLAEQIAELDATVANATAQRQEEKAKNLATIQEAKDAQYAVAQAVKVLKDFYAEASKATALVQQRFRQTPVEDSPSTWKADYQGMQSESGGVLGMLEVVESDFARLRTETTTAEDEAQRRFQGFLEDSEVDRAVKDKEMRHREYKRESSTRLLHEAQEDLASSQEELTDALAYFEKLKPSCINTGLSYEERLRRRREEIQSLTEALRILEGESIGAAA